MTILLSVLLTLSLLASGALAQTNSSGIPWDQLSPQEQRTLKRFADRWDDFPAARQERLRRGANRWSQMNPEERRSAKHNFRKWKQLSREQQERVRKRFERFLQLPGEEQRRLRATRQWFKSQPPERRQELRNKWRSMGPLERRRFRREFESHRPGKRAIPPDRERRRHQRPRR